GERGLRLGEGFGVVDDGRGGLDRGGGGLTALGGGLGDGLEAELDTRRFRLLDQVSARYEPPSR
ncbi:MAG: hypothetical protein ACOVKS_10165, partial [Aquimonas sp.]